jgi:hypothetical protein
MMDRVMPRRFDHTRQRIVGGTFGNYSDMPPRSVPGLDQAAGLRASRGLADNSAMSGSRILAGAKGLAADGTCAARWLHRYFLKLAAAGFRDQADASFSSRSQPFQQQRTNAR